MKKIISKSDEIINEVYNELRDRHLNPSGTFDNGGRWYAENADLIDVRSPSRAYPYSELVACRTKKYVTKVFLKYSPKTAKELSIRV